MTERSVNLNEIDKWKAEKKIKLKELALWEKSWREKLLVIFSTDAYCRVNI